MRRLKQVGALLGASALMAWVCVESESIHLPVGQVKQRSSSDWPMLGGSLSRNGVQPFAKNLPTEWAVEEGERKNVRWVADLGYLTYSSPVVAEGRVFIGTNNFKPRDPKYMEFNKRTGRKEAIDLGVLMCFRASDGEFLWQRVHEKLPSGRVHDWPLTGLVSSPAVEDGRLYYASNRCELICADVRDGREIWRLDMLNDLKVLPHNMTSSSPLVAGGLVFVVTGNGVDETHTSIEAPLAPSFLAVDKRTGKVVWQDNIPTVEAAGLPPPPARNAAFRALADKGRVVNHGQWSSPVFVPGGDQDQVIFPGGDGWLRSYDPPSGRLLWKFDGNPQNAAFNLFGKGDRCDIVAPPMVAHGKLYFTVGQDPEHETGVGRLWCVDLAKALAKGAVNPSRDVSPRNNNFDPNAAINADSALGWHFGGPAAANPTGRRYVFGRSLSTCAVADGLLYAADLNGGFYCLDAQTGDEHWYHDLRSPLWTSPLVADNKVFIGTGGDEVFVFAHGKQKKILGRNEMEGRIRSRIAAVDDTLFIAVSTQLYAIRKDR